MITRETATRIASAYAEIEAAQDLLQALRSVQRDEPLPDMRDASGPLRGYQLGVRDGAAGAYRLHDISPKLAESVVEAHIRDQQARLKTLCAFATHELGLVIDGDAAEEFSPEDPRS